MSTPAVTEQPSNEECTSTSSNLRPKSYSVSSSASIFTTSSISGDECPKNRSKSLSNRAFSSFEEDEEEPEENKEEKEAFKQEVDSSTHSTPRLSTSIHSIGLISPSSNKTNTSINHSPAQNVGTVRQNPLLFDQQPSSSKGLAHEKDYLTPNRVIGGSPRQIEKHNINDKEKRIRQMYQIDQRLKGDKKTDVDNQSPLYKCMMDMKGSPVSYLNNIYVIMCLTMCLTITTRIQQS